MLLPHALYVTLSIVICIVAAGFIVYIMLKALPRGNSGTASSLRGCLGIFGFMFLFLACLLSLTWAIPHSSVIIAGPDKDYSRKDAIFTAPKSLMEQYDCPDFEMGKSYIVNTTDRPMILYSVRYGNIIAFDVEGNVVEIPARKCTYIKSENFPDFYFEEPSAITVERGSAAVQSRWILDYSPLNP